VNGYRVGVRRDHPLAIAVGLKRVFFRVRPIVLSLAFSTMFSSTTLLFEQPQAPTREALGSLRAGQGDQLGLGRAVENSRTGRVRIVFTSQRRLEPFFHELLSHVEDRVEARVQSLCDLAVRPTVARLRRVRLQQDARPRQKLRRPLAAANCWRR